MNNTQKPHDALNADNLHVACVVDEQGREVPITRDMIRHSCEQLVQQERASQADKAEGTGA